MGSVRGGGGAGTEAGPGGGGLWRGSQQAAPTGHRWPRIPAALLQKYLDNYDLSIRVIYVLGTLGFSLGTAVMAMFANVYVAMVMISTMGVVSMSISYCPYALLGQYHDIKEVRGRRGRGGRARSRGAASPAQDAHQTWLAPELGLVPLSAPDRALYLLGVGSGETFETRQSPGGSSEVPQKGAVQGPGPPAPPAAGTRGGGFRCLSRGCGLEKCGCLAPRFPSQAPRGGGALPSTVPSRVATLEQRQGR